MIRKSFTCFWMYFLTIFSFVFQFQIFLHNFIQHIETYAIFFAIMCQKFKIFSVTSCAICARCHETYAGFRVKKTKNISVFLFQEGKNQSFWPKYVSLS